jgi:hypothetical protein
MANTAKLHHSETKAIGWYAMQHVRIADWFKPHRHKLGDESDKVGHSESMTANTHAEKQAQSSTDTNESQTDQQSSEKMLQKPSAHSKDAKKLRAVVRESHTILVKAKAVFPFQLFTDTINVDRHKLTIIYRQFWGIEQKVSVPIENIKNIEADLGPFFGTVTVTSDLFINNTQIVHFLWRDDAKKIQKLVQGMVVAQAEGIDLNKIETKQLREMLIDLGSGHSRSM